MISSITIAYCGHPDCDRFDGLVSALWRKYSTAHDALIQPKLHGLFEIADTGD